MLTFSSVIYESQLWKNQCKNKELRPVPLDAYWTVWNALVCMIKSQTEPNGVRMRNQWFASILDLEAELCRAENFRMQRYQSYKFELRPDGGQARQMRRIAGSNGQPCAARRANGD
jgi:hypothetical protein